MNMRPAREGKMAWALEWMGMLVAACDDVGGWRPPYSRVYYFHHPSLSTNPPSVFEGRFCPNPASY